MASGQLTTKGKGDAAEELALRHMQQAGRTLLVRNYRTPGRGGREIDLILRDLDGTLVFSEVCQRASTSHCGAAASVGTTKQRRIIFAARHCLMRISPLPPCRFDVVSVNGDGREVRIEWLRAAFDAW